MRYYVYILIGNDKKFYIGYTGDLKTRLTTHSKGLVKSTRKRRYLRLIHYEYFVNQKDAKAREVFLKSGGGHNQIHSFLKNTLKNT